MATWLIAVANKSLASVPVAAGSVGSVGYSARGNVGNVNFALPAVTRTRVPSKVNVTAFAGNDLEMSANNLPGTKTFPFWFMSAENFALVDVSKSDPERVTS